MTTPQVTGIAALFVLVFSSPYAENYNPMPGSFRPPAVRNSNNNQTGFRQDHSQFKRSPPQQQTWTSLPYGSTYNYAPPAAPPTQEYPPHSAHTDAWNRSININPNNMLNNMFGMGNTQSNTQEQWHYQPPAYQPSLQQLPTYQQPYYYGSSYPQQYSSTVPPIQAPTAAHPSRLEQPLAPLVRRPFAGKDTRFRPPELKGTD